jgi:hypothetical protein
VWFLAIVTVCLAIVVIPGLGRVLRYLSVAALVLGVGLLVWNRDALKQWDERLQWRRSLIAETEVSLSEQGLIRVKYGYRFSARVRNGSSKYAISDLLVRLTFRNCDSLGHCQEIYGSDAYIAQAIPSGEARGVTGHIAMKVPLQARNQLQWDARVTRVTALLPKE